MRRFNENDIIPSFHDFCETVDKQFSAVGVGTKILKRDFQIILNDNAIRDKKDIESSNGRYFIPSMWDFYIPFADYAGVYIFFDREKQGVYVGESVVEGGLGYEVSRYRRKCPEGGYVVVIPFKTAPFLSCAYEAYLLQSYSFPGNYRK
jgi:hypothetical protein